MKNSAFAAHIKTTTMARIVSFLLVSHLAISNDFAGLLPLALLLLIPTVIMTWKTVLNPTDTKIYWTTCIVQYTFAIFVAAFRPSLGISIYTLYAVGLIALVPTLALSVVPTSDKLRDHISLASVVLGAAGFLFLVSCLYNTNMIMHAFFCFSTATGCVNYVSLRNVKEDEKLQSQVVHRELGGIIMLLNLFSLIKDILTKPKGAK
jgi:hypothetical protein